MNPSTTPLLELAMTIFVSQLEWISKGMNKQEKRRKRIVFIMTFLNTILLLSFINALYNVYLMEDCNLHMIME